MKPLFSYLKTKRYLSLIEVLIAMALTILVLTTLLFFYQQMSLINKDIDTVKSQHFYLRYSENRFSEILPRIINEKNKDKEFVFFSINDDEIGMQGSQTLFFAFDNDVSRDQQFSNNVIARLYVDKQGNLTLVYWPSPKRQEKGEKNPPMKKEILLENVLSLHFEFFIPPEKSDDGSASKSQDTPSPEPKGGWSKQLWLKEFKTLPAMIKLNIDIKNEKEKKTQTLTFVFPLVNNLRPVMYD